MSDATGTFIVEESQAPEPIPAGLYTASFTGWTRNEGGLYGPFMRLEFEINDGEYTGTKRSMVCSAKLKKGTTFEKSTKLFRAVVGISGQEPEPGESLNLDDLIGTNVQILVEGSNEEGWQDVSKILPIAKEGKK